VRGKWIAKLMPLMEYAFLSFNAKI